MKNEFRKLRADEIEIRAAQINEKGASLLLYKDARCDMNILDETVGPMNWTRQHSRNNANCVVSIWDEDKKMWIGKEDTGTESNTEAEKGLASDSFKRACVNWGIGRELYTAPFIWVPAGVVKIEQNRKGKLEIKDELCVSEIQYDGNVIVSLEIKTDRGAVVYGWTKAGGTKATSAQHKAEAAKTVPVEVKKSQTIPQAYSHTAEQMDINAEYNRLVKKYGQDGFARKYDILVSRGVVKRLASEEMSHYDWVSLIRAFDSEFGDDAA